jgi:hypothetical protein
MTPQNNIGKNSSVDVASELDLLPTSPPAMFFDFVNQMSEPTAAMWAHNHANLLENLKAARQGTADSPMSERLIKGYPVVARRFKEIWRNLGLDAVASEDVTDATLQGFLNALIDYIAQETDAYEARAQGRMAVPERPEPTTEGAPTPPDNSPDTEKVVRPPRPGRSPMPPSPMTPSGPGTMPQIPIPNIPGVQATVRQVTSRVTPPAPAAPPAPAGPGRPDLREQLSTEYTKIHQSFLYGDTAEEAAMLKDRCDYRIGGKKRELEVLEALGFIQKLLKSSEITSLKGEIAWLIKQRAQITTLERRLRDEVLRLRDLFKTVPFSGPLSLRDPRVQRLQSELRVSPGAELTTKSTKLREFVHRLKGEIENLELRDADKPNP